MIKVGHIELFVEDPLQSLPFYRDKLGATVTAVQGEQYVWLDLAGVEILLRPVQHARPTAQRYDDAQSGIVLYCDSLETTAADLLQKGVSLMTEPGSAACYTFTDSDGHWFQLVDPSSH